MNLSALFAGVCARISASGRSLASLCFLVFASAAFAGNGGQNYLIVYDPGNPENIAIARHYQHLRDVPESNMMAYSFPRSEWRIQQRISDVEAYEFIEAIRAHIAARGLEATIHGVALAGETPIAIKGTGANTSSGALTTALWYAPNFDSVEDLNYAICTGDDLSPVPNYAFRGWAFDDPTTEIRSDKVMHTMGTTQYRYWLASHLGYTGSLGLRVEEVLESLSRSREADGTFDQGTIYWPINADYKRVDPRRDEIPSMEQEWDSIGLSHYAFGKAYSEYIYYSGGQYGPLVYGDFPYGRRVPSEKNGDPATDPHTEWPVQGVIAGFSNSFELEAANNTVTRGAIGEHMTSFGAKMGEALFAGLESAGPQMPMSEFIRYGFSGTSGTVTEPRNYDEKFPNPRIHTHYFNGATLAEAFIQSVERPAQLMIMGDPLCQPYAHIPNVSVSGVTPGQSVSGNITISASANGGAGVENAFDLYAGAVRLATFSGSYTLNTRNLSDGYHELRVVAFSNNAVRSQGYALISVRVNNNGDSASISGPASVNRRAGANFSVSASGISDLERIELRAAGRVLGQVDGSSGTLTISGDALGFHGPNRLFAVAVRGDGEEIWSTPKEVSVNWPLEPAETLAETLDATAVVNYWTDATAAGFDWSAPTGSLEVSDEFLIYDNKNGTAFPGLPVAAYGTGAIEMVTYLQVEESGLHTFGIQNNTGLELILNGRTILDTESPSNNPGLNWPFYVSERLAAGHHELRIRLKRIQSNSGLKLGVRSAYGRFIPVNRPSNAFLDFKPLGSANAVAGVSGDQPDPIPEPEPIPEPDPVSGDLAAGKLAAWGTPSHTWDNPKETSTAVTDGTPSTNIGTTTADLDYQWIAVDLGATHTIRRVELDWLNNRHLAVDYDVETSTDGFEWTPVLEVRGNDQVQTDDAVTPSDGRFVRVKVYTGYFYYAGMSMPNRVVLNEFRVYADSDTPAPSGSDLAADQPGAYGIPGQTWENSLGQSQSHTDGDPATSTGTRSSDYDFQWIGVDLGSTQWVQRIELDWRDSRHLAVDYDLEVSTDGSTWIPVFEVRGNDLVNTVDNVTPTQGRYVRVKVYTGYFYITYGTMKNRVSLTEFRVF